MDFGISIRQVNEVDLVVRAEEVGYDFCWVYDSPMISSSPWVSLAMAAQRTSTIRLGTGVAIPGLRMAPVTANSIATVNALAPGRTFLGVGTGNTAMRAMGQLPMKVAEYAENIRVIKGLLAGETVEYTANGITEEIAFQSLELEFINIEDHIPIHVGGFGPRAQALAGELGDGLITGIPRGGTVPQALANVQRGADRVGRTIGEDFETVALVNMLVLEPGEPLTSPRVLEEVGSSVMVNLHYMYDLYREFATPAPDYAAPIWDDYVAFREKRDADRSHVEAHGSHYGHLDPEEAKFVTPEVLRIFCIAGEPDQIIEQLVDLESQGLAGVNFIMPTERQYAMCDQFAHDVIAHYPGR